MANPVLKEGDRAPAFEARLDDGSAISSKELEGTRTILYFYPKDNTPGCTTEACDFRDNLARLTGRLNVRVIGVSPDSIESHRKFKTKYALPFALIADTDHTMATDFGVSREKKRYGKTRLGIVRSTFVIGPDGTIEKIYDNVRAKGHVDRLLSDLS